LFTVELPQTVTTGEEFDIVVRRISRRPLGKRHAEDRRRDVGPAVALHGAPPVIGRAVPNGQNGVLVLPETPISIAALPVKKSEARARIGVIPAFERYIVGSFQVKIPVSTRAAMLPAEEDTLAILKARVANLPRSNRWHPVLLRYVDQISERVRGLGGDPDAIGPDLLGHRHGRHAVREFSGKVTEVIFDCFGDFVGFVLDDCGQREAFESREKEIGELVLRTLRNRLDLTVITADTTRRIVRLAVKN
jgi:hypothetical protein